jgi:hypothetical protein
LAVRSGARQQTLEIAAATHSIMTTHFPDVLFGNAELSSLERKLGFSGRDSSHRRRVLALVCIGWVPLLALASFQEALFPGTSLYSFSTDVGLHCRALLAAPVLVLAEVTCFPHLAATCRHFCSTGLISEADRSRFDAICESAMSLEASRWTRLCVAALTYALVFWLVSSTHYRVPAWQHAGAGDTLRFTPGGWWHALVTLPALVALVLTWLWRLILWGRLMFQVAWLELRLVPAHPDAVGGIRFVVLAVRSFSPVGFAVGTIVAGALANDALLHGADLARLRTAAVGMLVFVLLVFAPPVLAFARPLTAARLRGIRLYGTLAIGVGRHFEQRWLGKTGYDDAVLKTLDFSAMNNLYATVSKVYDMKLVLVDTPAMATFAGVSLLPLAFVGVLSLPIEVVRSTIANLLF